MYLKEEEKAYMQKLVRNLFFNFGLKRALEEDRGGYYGSRFRKLYDWYDKKNSALDRIGVRITNGETKLVIIDRHIPNWVVKLCFKDNCFGKDYCEREADFYRSACEVDLGQFFAASYYVCEVAGYDIYAQEYAEPNDDVFSESFSEYVKNNFDYSREDYEDEYEYDEAIMDAVYDMDDEDRINAIFEGVAPAWKIADLVDFIQGYGINDLHSGNWGMTRDYRVVVFDYSGYYG